MSNIATVNKDEAVYRWMEQCDLLKDALLFQWLGENPDSCALVPIAGESVVKMYMDGSKLRVYDFALQVTLPISASTDTTNTDNMFLQRKWQDWLEDQEAAGNYPDFGKRCSDYSIENLSNMPQLAQQHENGTGKYQFFARINYREDV